MKSFLLVPAACLLLLAACIHQSKEPEIKTEPVVHTTEEAAIKKAVDDAYKFISFEKGGQVHFEDVKKYFMREAQLSNFRNDTLEVMNITQYMDVYKEMLKSNSIQSFYEEEIAGTTEQFGRIAHRISTYATYINTKDSVAERGVNSFQLIKTAEGWKVSGILWDVESAALKIPAHYLKK